jgi:hypothetical protein
VTVIVPNVPTQLTTGPDGQEIRGYSMGVALRLAELVKYALEGNPVGTVTLELELKCSRGFVGCSGVASRNHQTHFSRSRCILKSEDRS